MASDGRITLSSHGPAVGAGGLLGNAEVRSPNGGGGLLAADGGAALPPSAVSISPSAPHGGFADEAARHAQELAWVVAAKTGDRAAFGNLALLYQRQCAAVAMRLLGNSHDAAELVQDALVSAFKNMGQLNQSERFGSWLLRIVSNMALNLRRARSKRPVISLDQAGGSGEAFANRIPGGEAPDKPLTSAELGAAIQRAIDNLPEKQRLALVMFAVNQLPQREVAEILNCSVEAVKWHVFMARKQLKKSLAGYL
jgi:RNA polymerase sigma-70 factor (ECF subfamily)